LKRKAVNEAVRSGLEDKTSASWSWEEIKW
jgi:hypothetical protein